MFQFKQFAVDQSDCAMKINTDGVLLGAVATANQPKQILDIGTGTGVIALMLAQRFKKSQIDAVEIDKPACETATRNFAASKFSDRLKAHHSDFEEFLNENPEIRYHLIISNPPFYINSLKSPEVERSRAKHADQSFFEMLIAKASQHLTDNGMLWLIVPIDTSLLIRELAIANQLKVSQLIEVKSYKQSEPHRHIIAFSFEESYLSTRELVIYREPKLYTEDYIKLLKDFFTIF